MKMAGSNPGHFSISHREIVGWAKAHRAVPTVYARSKLVGTLRFAHPTALRFSRATAVQLLSLPSLKMSEPSGLDSKPVLP